MIYKWVNHPKYSGLYDLIDHKRPAIPLQFHDLSNEIVEGDGWVEIPQVTDRVKFTDTNFGWQFDMVLRKGGTDIRYPRDGVLLIYQRDLPLEDTIELYTVAQIPKLSLNYATRAITLVTDMLTGKETLFPETK